MKNFDPQSLVGLNKEEAYQIAKDNNRIYRTTIEDGKRFALTYDLKDGRLNFAIDNGKITSVREESIGFVDISEVPNRRHR